MNNKQIQTYVVQTEENLKEIAEKILAELQHPLILMVGELGAGKTSLVKAIMEILKIEDNASSPSFSLINEYRIKEDKKVFHIDLYRLQDPEEVFNLGIEEYLYSGNYCFVEWPQIILDYIEPPYHLMQIEIMENNSRKITLS